MLSASGSRAQGDDQLSRLRLGGGPVPPEPPGEQLAGFGPGEQVEGEQRAPFGADRLVSWRGWSPRPGSPACRAAAAAPGRDRGRCRARRAPAGRPAGCDTGRPALSRLAGIALGGNLQGVRKPRIASAGSAGGPAGSKPRRFTYSCPSGNRSAAWWAQCTASAVLPIPGVPPIADISTVPRLVGILEQAGQGFSSSVRPAKPEAAAGSCRGTATSGGWAAGRRGCAVAGWWGRRRLQ